MKSNVFVKPNEQSGAFWISMLNMVQTQMDNIKTIFHFMNVWKNLQKITTNNPSSFGIVK